MFFPSGLDETSRKQHLSLIIMDYIQTKATYQPLAKDEEDQSPVLRKDRNSPFSSKKFSYLAIFICFILTAAGGFLAGTFFNQSRRSHSDGHAKGATAPRIPAPVIEGEFVFKSPFSQEPPQGDGSGEKSEPIWDALIPSKSLSN